MKKLLCFIPFILLLFPGCCTCLSQETKDMLVSEVDLEQYSGLWYQVARYDHRFQSDDCAESTAEYTLRPDGKMSVLNRCWKDQYGGEYTQQIRATAESVNEQHSWLRVWFFRVIPANYLIIGLDKDYQWACVTTPNKKSLWILSRTPSLDAITYKSIVDSLVAQGFHRDEMIKTSRQGEIE